MGLPWITASFDPYDIWASPFGISCRKRYYSGSSLGKLYVSGIGLLDWLFPMLGRRLACVQPKIYPISLGHEILRFQIERQISESEAKELLDIARRVGIKDKYGSIYSWGLGFPWMSKNGLYESDVPFVTHTPYVMEALLVLAKVSSVNEDALQLFYETWTFLVSLKVMVEYQDCLALSYAPIDEPRIVINANAYSAFSYALHAVHGKKEIREVAKRNVAQIVRWLDVEQNDDGSWLYYADQDPGNFIDCFHSCFVVKNLLKVTKLLPELSDLIHPVINKGWKYIRSELYDKDTGLCRRFSMRAQKDPFCLDLYDQAEYLGLLVDFGLLDEAAEFAARIEKKFRKGEHWYCRIDIFGRRWGKDFLRWGIVPFWYHQARLTQKYTIKNQ